MRQKEGGTYEKRPKITAEKGKCSNVLYAHNISYWYRPKDVWSIYLLR